MIVSSPPPQPTDHLSVFAEKERKFDDADTAFRDLIASLDAYKDAVRKAADCGVAVAEQMDKFFGSRDAEQKQLVTHFHHSQNAIRTKWIDHSEKLFDADVLTPIQSRLDEIPKVRDYVKLRSVALAEMQKRQKKLQSERKKDGSRLRDKQRRLKEISDRYAMFHDEVIQRFNYIDRNMGTFVTAPLRSLVVLMADVSKSTVESLEGVVKLVSETPPITKELSPAPAMASLTNSSGGIVDTEAWDDAYAFDDDDDVDDDDEHDAPEPTDADTDSASARASGRRPPRGRVRSADDATRGPNALLSGLDSNFSLGLDLSTATSPRRGRSVSSTPADSATLYQSNLPLPLGSSISTILQRDSQGAPGSASGRASHAGQEPFYLPSVGTSAASSTSTENIMQDGVLKPHSAIGIEHYDRRRYQREGRGSADTVGSGDQLVRNEVLMRLVAVYDFSPQESNELEIRTGDVIEVSAKNDSGWWCGRCGKSTGYFPKTYTRELTEQEELDYLAERRRRKRRGHRRQDSHESKKSGLTASSLAAS